MAKRTTPTANAAPFTHAAGAPVADNTNIMTAGRRGPALLQDIWLIEKMAHFDREVIPERRMHAKGWGAYGTFTVTHDITRYTRAKIFSKIGKETPMFARFSTVAGERGAAEAERDIRGFAVKFYGEEGNWDIVGNNTPVFFFRDPLRFPDLNHAIKRDPRTGMRSADNNWDFWTLLPEALRHMHGFGSHTFSLINAASTFRSTRRNARFKAITATARCGPTAISARRSRSIRTASACGTISPTSPSRRCRSRARRTTTITASTMITGSSRAISFAR